VHSDPAQDSVSPLRWVRPTTNIRFNEHPPPFYPFNTPFLLPPFNSKANDTRCRNRRQKSAPRLCSVYGMRLASNFYWRWNRIETALFLCRKPAWTAFADWLTDLFTFSASPTVWDFWIWGTTWDFSEIAAHIRYFRGTLNNKAYKFWSVKIELRRFVDRVFLQTFTVLAIFSLGSLMSSLEFFLSQKLRNSK